MKHLLPLVCFTAFMTVPSSAGIVDPSLKQRFSMGGLGDTQNIMVSFIQSIQTVIQQNNAMNFSSISEKRTALTNSQKGFTADSQKPLQDYLNTNGIKYQSFWINNKMTIQGVNSGLVNAISSVPGVAKVEEEPTATLTPPHAGQGNDDQASGRVARQTTAQWNVRKIRADQVWKSYTGEGIVVSGIDSGVRYTHELLKNNWRGGEYGWYDTYAKSEKPSDFGGHGTHTMGTIVGANGFGVAPGATWIACKACFNNTNCGGSNLFACGQWVQCPTKTDGSSQNCDMAPHIASNSWNYDERGTWFDEVIDSWQASGIIPVFSIGNNGPDCRTYKSPAENRKVISVGSTDYRDRISTFSSLGPASNDGSVKPDIVAPGDGVLSSVQTGDDAYDTYYGTSMSCPHVSGVIALMLEKNSNLNYNQIYSAITRTTVKRELDTTNAIICGGRVPSRFPNNVFGYGRIDALNSVNAV